MYQTEYRSAFCLFYALHYRIKLYQAEMRHNSSLRWLYEAEAAMWEREQEEYFARGE